MQCISEENSHINIIHIISQRKALLKVIRLLLQYLLIKLVTHSLNI